VAAIGAELLNRIVAAHSRLNAPDVLPEKAHRRNTAIYQLVCYINNVVGCYLSSNFAAIPLFIERARGHMASIQPAPDAAT
jgi:hypothetical protein